MTIEKVIHEEESYHVSTVSRYTRFIERPTIGK